MNKPDHTAHETPDPYPDDHHRAPRRVLFSFGRRGRPRCLVGGGQRPPTRTFDRPPRIVVSDAKPSLATRA